MLDKIENIKKLQLELDAAEEDLMSHIVEKLNLKDELLDVVGTILENIDEFESAEQVQNVILAMAPKAKPSSSKTKRRKDKHDA